MSLGNFSGYSQTIECQSFSGQIIGTSGSQTHLTRISLTVDMFSRKYEPRMEL